jgi:glycerol-3-phosphate acyltransferase PlsX
LRKKKDSSLRVAIELVKNGEADACVSAGNTGALMATARYVLKTLPGIDRPAIISAVPGLKGPTFMLDLGANVGCTSQHLLQFALMGSVVAGDMLETVRPRVGLLNIGQEDIKGNEVVREAGELLARSGLNYVGFVEGDGIFNADVDVVVSDGFVGNVALKASEGVAQMITAALKDEFKRTALTKLAALVALPVLKAFRIRMDHRRYNGASLLGLRGIVIKSHGSADSFAFEQALGRAVEEVQNNVPQRIARKMSELPAGQNMVKPAAQGE